MRLENYINQLMFQHDCVIVPKFGAFVSHPTSATIIQEEQTIIPPHNAVSFNSSLTTSDGLLEKKYALEENISIENASSQIEEDVNDWNYRLNNGETIVLENIGTLNNDADGVLNFKPHTTENFLADAYGLRSIKPNLILNNPEVAAVLPSSKRNWSSFLAVASIIPIIVGGYFYFNTPQPVQKFVDHQWSGIVLPAIQEAAPNLLNSASKIEKIDQLEDVIHNLPTTISNPLEYVQAGTSVSLPAETDSTGQNVLSRFEITVVEEKQLNEDEKEVKAIIRNSKVDANSLNSKSSNSTTKDVAKTTKTEDNNNTAVKGNDKKSEDIIRIESNPKKFQVIAASLRRADDAARMLRFLESEGYKNANIVYVKGRFYYVTFDSFDNMEQASKYLNNLHKQRPDAWIREHN
ncbi:HU domain-containing protein [Faecalibacter bovis]|uniref:SPOR domain-containing protein n=1 Tax=Faecalibacter bovis TaxID=2898187 RepID=A0ABX7XF69_9FLAO|nr:SPOR domain-containing protein [Faecalibacter bovis]QTV06518.1 SPOR domain-containing protein [Faecalibacter bovis]